MSDTSARETYIDVNAGLSRLRGNKPMYCKMLNMFLESKSFGELETAAAAGDTQAASEAAHAIKGVAGNLSLTRLFDDANTLMRVLREGAPYNESLAAYRDTLEITQKYVTEVIKELSV